MLFCCFFLQLGMSWHGVMQGKVVTLNLDGFILLLSKCFSHSATWVWNKKLQRERFNQSRCSLVCSTEKKKIWIVVFKGTILYILIVKIYICFDFFCSAACPILRQFKLFLPKGQFAMNCQITGQKCQNTSRLHTSWRVVKLAFEYALHKCLPGQQIRCLGELFVWERIILVVIPQTCTKNAGKHTLNRREFPRMSH